MHRWVWMTCLPASNSQTLGGINFVYDITDFSSKWEKKRHSQFEWAQILNLDERDYSGHTINENMICSTTAVHIVTIYFKDGGSYRDKKRTERLRKRLKEVITLWNLLFQYLPLVPITKNKQIYFKNGLRLISEQF